MEKLDKIIDGLISIRNIKKLEVSDDVLWDSAIRIFNSENINRKKGFSEDKIPNEIEPPTEKQKYFLKKLGQKIPATKKEATKIISKLK